jgi:hypothetical protein
VRIELSDAERSELRARAPRRKIARVGCDAGDAMRAEIVLLAVAAFIADGSPRSSGWDGESGFSSGTRAADEFPEGTGRGCHGDAEEPPGE